MEKETFKDKLTRSNTEVRGITDHLGLKGIDLDDIDVTGTIEYSLHPDYRNYGLDGIEVRISRIEAEITWGMYTEYLTPEELERVKAAGGIEYNNERIEGSFKLSVKEYDDGNWDIDTKDCEFTPKGAFQIGEIEFELGGTGKNSVTIK